MIKYCRVFDNMALDNPSYFSMSTGTSATLPSTSRSCKFTTFFGTNNNNNNNHNHNHMFTNTNKCNDFHRISCSQTLPAVTTCSSGTNTSIQFPQPPLQSIIPTSGCAGATNITAPLPPPLISALPNCTKRNIRTLLRSVSANSTESNQELLIMGEPRPSDIAPPSPVFEDHNIFNFNTNTHDISPTNIHHHPFIVDSPAHHPRRTKSFTRKSTDLNSLVLHQNDLVYCRLPTSDNDDVDDDEDNLSNNLTVTSDENEEVFLQENSVRYYNLASHTNTTNLPQVPRRHSIGATYYTTIQHNRDRNTSVASSSTANATPTSWNLIESPEYEQESTASAAVPIDIQNNLNRDEYSNDRVLPSSSSPTISEQSSIIVHATADGEAVKPTIITSTSASSTTATEASGPAINSNGIEPTPSISTSSSCSASQRSGSIVSSTLSSNGGTAMVTSTNYHGSAGGTRDKQKCHRCAPQKGLKTNKMCNGTGNSLDDIVIIFSRESEVAGLWAPYLSTCFDQISQERAPRHPFKVLHMTIEDINSGIGVNMEERLATVKLQIIILCPQFINIISDIATSTTAAESPTKNVFHRIFQPDRALGMLLGVSEQHDIMEHHKTVLTSYHHWKRIAVKDQDPTLVGEFLDSAMTIISRIARQQYIAAQQEKSQFSVVPKKVKMGQRRVIVLLNDPLQKDDNIKVSVDKSIEMIEIPSVKRRNPYTLQFSIPECCLEVSMMINVVVEKNGSLLGSQPIKCESRLRELDQLLRTNDNPVEFMCQTLGFSSTSVEQLDNFMVHAFQRNLPPHFNLLMPTGLGISSPQKTTPEEYPTLLHFAARFGLEKLAWQLLECPGGEQACEIRNFCELTPAEIAENAGHIRLAQALRGYMQMSEFSNMYHMLKGMTEKTENQNGGETNDEYLLPRPIGETYSVPPSARPFSPPSSLPLPITGYMEMNSNGKHTPSPKAIIPNLTLDLAHNHNMNLSMNSPSDKFTDIKQLCFNQKKEHSAPNTLRKQISNGEKDQKPSKVIEDHVQAELAEIINDFKNNVFTIQEVEQLVENWKNRNDVQQSFRDKQEALMKMREEYDRIQKLMKDEMKKSSTPFDRLKKFFSRNKSKHHNDTNHSKEDRNSNSSQSSQQSKSNGDNSCQNHRPVSSLSQSSSSSSSSARMSTASGCSGISFGDSGTHSDIDERKHLFTFHSNLDQTLIGSTYNNYLIPPAPKPVFKYGTSPGRSSPQNVWKFKPIEEQDLVPDIKSSPNPNCNDFYIQFPPSGMPVSTNIDNKLDQIKENELHLSETNLSNKSTQNLFNVKTVPTNSQEYINISAGIAQKELEDNDEYLNDEDDVEEKLLPEYMNFQPVVINNNTSKNGKKLPLKKTKDK